MKSRNRFALFALALLAAACSSSGDSKDNSVNVSLSGVGAKGLLAGADVGVYAVNADGTVASSPLATTATDKDGHYSLSFSGTQGQPYVVRIGAKADGSTTEADEVSGATVALPAGFAMRALLIPASTGSITTSVNVTPFSELAAAAAAKATGGITAANAAQAVSTVKQLLGFDPAAVKVATTRTAVSADEQRQAVLLTAVAQMAGSGALGCSGTAGARVKCIVDALGAAASTTTLKLAGAGGDDVSAALASAIGQVLTSDLAGTVNAATLTNVVANLGCTTNCSAAGTTPSGDALASGIAAARLLFAQVKSDWMAMFSGDGITSVSKGAANAQAFRFSQAMGDIQQPAATMLLDARSLYLGVSLYNDYKAGRTATTFRGEGTGNVPTSFPGFFAGLNQSACQLYQDALSTVNATAPANANYIGCSTYYYADLIPITNGNRTIYYRHAFVLTPGSDGSFSWQGRARQTINDCTPSCVRTANNNLQADPVTGADVYFSGTIAQTVTGGNVTAFALNGEFPAGFATGDSALVNYKYALSSSVSRTLDAVSGDLVGGAIAASSFISKDAAGATLSTLTIKSGQLVTTPVSSDAAGNLVAPSSPRAVAAKGYLEVGMSLDLEFATPGGAAAGVFSLSDPAWDKSLSVVAATKTSFSGTLSTIDSGVTTHFVTGTATGTLTGFPAYDATQPLSASNSYAMAAAFVGTVTAPNRPLLELSLSGSAQTDAHAYTVAQPVTLQYRTLVGGQARTVVSITGSPASATSQDITRFAFSEAASGLSAAWSDTDTKVKLMKDTLEIGTLDVATQVITFKDGSLMSLDIGL